MKMLLTRGALVVTAIAAALALGSLPWTPPRRAASVALGPVARGHGPLRAGYGEAALEPPAPVLAGYARLRWAALGRRDPTRVRALALDEPGCRVVLVSADLLLVPAAFQRAVAARVGDLAIDRLLVAATHTHAGPGGYWDQALGARLATGPYDPAVLDGLAAQAAAAVRQAVASLAPAALQVARGAAPGLAQGRGGSAAVDGRLLLLTVLRRDGVPLARAVSFPAHATLLGADNRLVSGDWPGALERAPGPPLLFFQGALGDQRPRLPGATPEGYAAALARAVDALAGGPADPAPPLAAAAATATLPEPAPGAVPALLRPLARNVLHARVPARAEVVALRLGPLTWLAVPAEPVAEVGRRWRAAAGDGSEVLALAGDYLGYVETPERLARGEGESARTYYGAELQDRLAAAALAAARALER